jgi:alanine racemase
MKSLATSITNSQLAEWCQGSFLSFAGTTAILDIAIDSRKIDRPEVSIFVALQNSLRDGHGFIPMAYDKGVRNFLVSQQIDTNLFPLASFILVKDTLSALQQIATLHRKQFNIPVIGITGSNGKTIVKEWLYQLLGVKYNTVRSPKSFNSQIGVPLSVWLMNPAHELAIFEAGISQPGEMEKLERIIQPEIGVFTNIGEAHSEGFLSMRQKMNEKLLLFRNTKHLVYCRDHHELNEAIAQFVHLLQKADDHKKPLQLFSWSYKPGADLYITKVEQEIGRTKITAKYLQSNMQITIPFTDPASIENAIHCWSVMLLLGIAQDTIAAGMLSLQSVSMRLELKHGINNCTIINDTYNSDLSSLRIALDYLEQQKQHFHHTLILSDMLQVGRPDHDLYDEVAALISRKNVHRFIGIGPALYKCRSAFRAHKKIRSLFFKSTEAFLKKIHLLTFEKEAVLLKGARVFAFEKINMLLEQKLHQTVLVINLASLTHNLNIFRQQLQPGVKTMAMVKAFAYGSGSYEIAHVLQLAGVDYLAVAYTDEGIALRKSGITMPIMVMSPDAVSFDRMIAWNLEPELFSFNSLRAFIAIAENLEIEAYPVHIKLDTGMHRLGFMPHEADELYRQLQHTKCLTVKSIFSHLAASDDRSMDEFTLQQATVFTQVAQKISDGLPQKPLWHLSNSSAIIGLPTLHFDMVRLGLGLYGIESTGLLQNTLKPISTLKTTITQIKNIPAGDSIGYGRKAYADAAMRIAVISIGYADGYQRALGNGKAYVIIHGKPATILGVVCMDMCMVDVTQIPQAQEGDEVIVFGKDLPIEKLASWAGTIPYEMMTGISQRVKRVYINED